MRIKMIEHDEDDVAQMLLSDAEFEVGDTVRTNAGFVGKIVHKTWLANYVMVGAICYMYFDEELKFHFPDKTTNE